MEDAWCCWLVAWWDVIETPLYWDSSFDVLILRKRKKSFIKTNQLAKWNMGWILINHGICHIASVFFWAFVCVCAYSAKVTSSLVFYIYRYEHISEDSCSNLYPFDRIMTKIFKDKRNDFASVMYINLRRPTVRYFSVSRVFVCVLLLFFATLVEFILIKLIPLAYFDTHRSQFSDKFIEFDSQDKEWFVLIKKCEVISVHTHTLLLCSDSFIPGKSWVMRTFSC